MSYPASHIAQVINAEITGPGDGIIEHLLPDSRKVFSPASSLFFALKGPRRDGHQFIPELYGKGVRHFVVTALPETIHPDATYLKVEDTTEALQQLAAWHRSHFRIPVIGITGSNGKTIVKEWLYQLLHTDLNIVRSPRSYNSQTGVPLSVWQMNERHSLAIFEAGISKPGEMEKLEKIIKPTIGVFTSIGEAHSEGFSSKQVKEKEKRILFRNAKLPEPLLILEKKQEDQSTIITARHRDTAPMTISIPFTDDASASNAITCWEVMLMLGYDHDVIRNRMKLLVPVNMRLELKKGIQGCVVINDSYSADTSSLGIALNFLEQQGPGTRKTVILSDFLQTGVPPEELYAQVMNSLKKHHVNRVIGIGEQVSTYLLPGNHEDITVETFLSTDDFIRQFRFSSFRDESILVKGARLFAFERIVHLLEEKAHQTVLEINLSAIVHNLQQYQQHLDPATKVMAMVKAFAYGSGGAEIAGILQYHKVDYLGVAYADEGVELRKAGITLPIMVMNPEVNAFEAIIEHNLEPELYSFGLLHAFDEFLQKEGLQHYPVHIEIETGMNRLGFSPVDIGELCTILKKSVSFRVQSVFSHLAASEDPAQDAFTEQQAGLFKEAVEQLRGDLGYDFIRHISNSAAAIRHPALQLDMVRLGIGLYGVDSAASGKLNLQAAAVLKSTIAQIKEIQPGDSVSYNRMSVADRLTRIATIRIGYADGYPRRLGNRTGQVFVKDRLVPILGAVCMDMFMADITDVPGVKEGDEVILFGTEPGVVQLAKWAGTIPYEIMTGVSQRVKRVYFQE